MEKELNIAAILKDKPKGTKLFDTLRGINVCLDSVGITLEHIYCTGDGCSHYYTNTGGFSDEYPNGMQILKPSKSMRDWSKFTWKKGDVLYAESIDNYCIFNKFADDEYTTFEGKFLFDARNLDVCNSNYFNESTDEFVKVSDDNTKIILSDLASLLGGKLNLSTLEIEKPQLKDGDILVVNERDRMPKGIFIFDEKSQPADLSTQISISAYAFYDTGNSIVTINDGVYVDGRKLQLATDSEKQQLFDALAKENKAWDADKKAIVDLPKKCEFKAFDKVLVRDYKEYSWIPRFFADISGSYTICTDGDAYSQCIPYNEETAHLLGTTDDWEGGEE